MKGHQAAACKEIMRLTQLQRQLFACVGEFGCVLPINTGSADREVTGAPGATCLSAHPGANAPNMGRVAPYA